MYGPLPSSNCGARRGYNIKFLHRSKTLTSTVPPGLRKWSRHGGVCEQGPLLTSSVDRDDYTSYVEGVGAERKRFHDHLLFVKQDGNKTDTLREKMCADVDTSIGINNSVLDCWTHGILYVGPL